MRRQEFLDLQMLMHAMIEERMTIGMHLPHQQAVAFRERREQHFIRCHVEPQEALDEAMIVAEEELHGWGGQDWSPA